LGAKIIGVLAVGVVLGFVGVEPGPLAQGATRVLPHTLSLVAPSQGMDFTAVGFASPTSGWVIGPDFVWHTGDGGRTWQVQMQGSLSLAGIEATSATTA
jgi:hypothetical protein